MKQPKCYGIYIFGTDISLRYMWRRARIPMQGSGRVVRSDDCDECGARGGQGDSAQGESDVLNQPRMQCCHSGLQELGGSYENQ